MHAQPLPPFYYLEHFKAVLRLLRERDHDLLTPTESDFIHAVFELPPQAQALIARMAARSKAVFCESSLRYPELSDLHRLLTVLQAAGWINTDPVVTMPQLFAALPVSRLANGFGLKLNRTLNKGRMLRQAQEMYPGSYSLSATSFRIQELLYQFKHAELCRRLCAQYFGNHHQDWSQYLIADRGIRRYECVKFDAVSRPFRIRQEIDTFHGIQLCAEMLDADSSAASAQALLPEPPTTCDWLKERHQRVAYRLAQRLERERELNAALAIYRSHESSEAVGRVRIVSRKLTGGRAGPRVSRRAVAHIDLSLSHAGEQKIEQRVASELERMEPACEVRVVENRLFDALFGLLFWRVLFAPVRGAFFHAFQTSPADLYGAQFCDQRRSMIDEALEALHTGDYIRSIRETFNTKAGISNPWVAWRWLRASTLERALECIPAQHLLVIFQWMLGDLRRNTTGFPDLIQYWPSEARYRLLEVKLGADRLQDNQRQFLQYASHHDLPVSVCYVTAPSLPSAARMRRSRTPPPVNVSLNLFPVEAVMPPNETKYIRGAAGEFTRAEWIGKTHPAGAIIGPESTSESTRE
jgi:hypothetical protein